MTESIIFPELFTPRNYSSASRAQLFLWLCHHFLEGPPNAEGVRPDNPFAHPDHPTTGPPLDTISDEVVDAENEETEEDREILKRLLAQRNDVVKAQIDKSQAQNNKAEDTAMPDWSESQAVGPVSSRIKSTPSKNAANAKGHKPTLATLAAPPSVDENRSRTFHVFSVQ